MDGVRMHRATVQAAKCVARILLVAVLAIVCAVYLMIQVEEAFPDAHIVDIGGIAARSAVYIAPLIPLVPVSFIAGYADEGSRVRLVVRIASGIYLAGAILLLSSDLWYSVADAPLIDAYGATMESARMSVGYRSIGVVLLILPACSIADAALEYRQHSDSVENQRFP